MPTTALAALFLATLLYPSPKALGATIQRCDDDNGHVTFTTLGCRPNEHLSLHSIQPPTPGNSSTAMPEAAPAETSRKQTEPQSLTIVGQSEDKCDRAPDARERREAIIDRRIIVGMNRQDVESALGKPNRVRTKASSTDYYYDDKKGRSANITFDGNGCVKAKSQTAKSPR
ncbi:SmpA / OmlA family protein [Pseudomonas sp. ok272]|uniref:outer membrane protein assembly factor BamE domain-containing protein n=1 Tax=unclassified Pseudomonas TaxID=196821 RepID=UPI0008BA68C6|nr:MULTISPECIES: outer membrane protein assembly factor BamE [unclassified Pseudomonas]SEM38339.1 SmpA / OmlA family protein [Pseudomonas sp. ok272]SFM38973.1 SmpA / OmlA family protein [Pseudomonas sp. ok602]